MESRSVPAAAAISALDMSGRYAPPARTPTSMKIAEPPLSTMQSRRNISSGDFVSAVPIKSTLARPPIFAPFPHSPKASL